MKKNYNFKSVEEFEEIAHEDNYIFEAVSSSPKIDRHGESISSKALEKVAKNQKEVPMFYGHAGDNELGNILGKFEIKGVENGELKVKGVMPKGLPQIGRASCRERV